MHIRPKPHLCCGMVKRPIQHRKPVVGLLDRPYRETDTLGRKAGDPWRVFCMEKEYLQSYVLSQEYFSTLAALLTVVKRGVATDFRSPGTDKDDCMEFLDDFVTHLLFLQNAYDITEKKGRDMPAEPDLWFACAAPAILL